MWKIILAEFVDVYSSKLPIIIIIILAGIFLWQLTSNENNSPRIDSETCESKCLEFKNLNP
jgi:hypothetical protein